MAMTVVMAITMDGMGNSNGNGNGNAGLVEVVQWGDACSPGKC